MAPTLPPGWLARLVADIAVVTNAYENPPGPGRLIPPDTMMALGEIRAPKGPRRRRGP